MAHIMPRSVFDRLRLLSQGNARLAGRDDDSDNDSTHNPDREAAGDKDVSKDNKPDNHYEPSPIDIVVVRILLVKGLHLPPDIIDMVFDHAEYWAHSTNEIDFGLSDGRLSIYGSSDEEDKLLLRSYPLGFLGFDEESQDFEKRASDPIDRCNYSNQQSTPRTLKKEHDSNFFAKLPSYPTPKLVSPARKVVFSIKGTDQQWITAPAAQKSYESAWSWYEAGLEKFEADSGNGPVEATGPCSLKLSALRPVYPTIKTAQSDEDSNEYEFPIDRSDKWTIRRNKTAIRDWQEHQITWSYLDDVHPESDAAEKLAIEDGRGRATGDGSFVRDLRLGDVITVWSKVRFPAWVNSVEKAKIDVYWAV